MGVLLKHRFQVLSGFTECKKQRAPESQAGFRRRSGGVSVNFSSASLRGPGRKGGKQRPRSLPNPPLPPQRDAALATPGRRRDGQNGAAIAREIKRDIREGRMGGTWGSGRMGDGTRQESQPPVPLSLGTFYWGGGGCILKTVLRAFITIHEKMLISRAWQRGRNGPNFRAVLAPLGRCAGTNGFLSGRNPRH